MVRRLFPLALILLALSGCSTQGLRAALSGFGAPTLRFVLTFDTTDAARRTELLEASKRVIERRLSRWEEVDPKKWIAEEQLDGSTLIEIPVGSREARETVEKEVLTPFDLKIMTLSTEEKGLPAEAPTGAKAGDLYVEEQGWFNATGITQHYITWTESAVDDNSRGVVHLIFSPEGRTLLTTVYHEHLKGTLGLFVRGRLMSKLMIETPEPTGEIIISGIPIPNLAAIFSDDVNVGSHVTFALP